MRLSTRGRYGLRAMVELALAPEGTSVNLRDISARQQIATCYLEQILRKLRNAGLVKSIRGPRGGFVLAKPAERIRAWDVIAALEEDVAPVHCVDQVVGARATRKPCPRAKNCPTRPLWAGLARQMRGYLESRTVRDLASVPSGRGKGEGKRGAPMFYI